jgi:hypothetical protein
MMRMPCAEVLDRWVIAFDGAKDLLLVFSILKEARPCTPSSRSGIDHSIHVNVENPAALICTNYPTSGLDVFVPIALIEHSVQHGLCNGNANAPRRFNSH